MKKILLLFFTFFSISSTSWGQEEGIFRLSVAGEHFRLPDRSISSLGLDLEVFVSDHLSLSYRYAVRH